MSTVTHVTAATFEAEVLGSEVPVLVDFYATWCMPCRMLSPALERLADELQGRAKIVKVDVDEEPQLAASHAIHAVPTLKLYHRGRVRETIQGLVPPATLKSKLESLSAAPSAAATV